MINNNYSFPTGQEDIDNQDIIHSSDNILKVGSFSTHFLLT